MLITWIAIVQLWPCFLLIQIDKIAFSLPPTFLSSNLIPKSSRSISYIQFLHEGNIHYQKTAKKETKQNLSWIVHLMEELFCGLILSRCFQLHTLISARSQCYQKDKITFLLHSKSIYLKNQKLNINKIKVPIQAALEDNQSKKKKSK